MEEQKLKKTLKSYLLGFISATLAASCVTAFAANTTTLYDVIVNGIKIVVDGKQLNPTDADGNKVEPIIYNGTTYLPVRAVADAFGKAVYWDGPNMMVYLGTMNGTLDYPTIRMEDISDIGDGRMKKVSTLTDNYGHKYNTAFGTDWQHTSYHALLKGQFSKFKGTLYVPKDTASNVVATMFIEVDGKAVYTSPDMTKTSRPVDINIDISNANEMRITYTQEGGYNFFGYNLCFGDAGFYQ